MRVEVVAIGTELLLGQINDTNSSWIGEHLAMAGIDTHFQVKVGDNQDRMVSALRIALSRADAVICCGGLGPTQDDITREAIAEVMGVALVRDEAIVDRVRAMFTARGRVMAENNARQGDVPVGATVIDQVKGTAPGLICPLMIDCVEKVIYAVPGVPYEMMDYVERVIIPDLQARSGEVATIRSRTLRTWGAAESAIAEMVAPRLEALDLPGAPPATIAFLASGIEGIKVRITAKAPDEAQVQKILAEEETKLREILGGLVFGVDAETMEAVAGRLLLTLGKTVAVAESVTGGLVSSRMVAVPGASGWFRGAIVSYASEVKFDLLGVPEGPVVSSDAAAAMAAGVADRLGADVGLAITGVAGPEIQDGQSVGTVFVAVSDDRGTVVQELKLPGDRERIRQFGAISAVDLLRRHLLSELSATSTRPEPA
jgi:nicotinamide-nucleotide amidase